MARVVLSVLMTLVLVPSSALALTIKMGTMAPDGSTWDKALNRIGERWKQASAGKVKLRVYPGGVTGDEGDVVRKMRINQLQAGALTGPGLQSISPAPQAVSTPLMITSYDELDAVMEQVRPTLDRALEEKGFVALAWTDAGAMHFFAKKPAATPAAAQAQKVWAVEGDPDAVTAWRNAGFQPVALSSVNVMPSLQTGMIDSFVSTPLVALPLGWYSAAPNMTNVPIGMLIGAVVVSKKAWDKVPAQMRPELKKIAQEEADRIRPVLRAEEKRAVDAMAKRGLTVVQATPEQRAQWYGLEEKLFASVRGKVVPTDVFDAVKKARDAHRAKRGTTAAR